ncbi:MAG TPA: nucleoside deaminase [Rhodanobacteraceae bacterium]|nr:nucleoside deaminase [Rhodanobacteraceae bacterium]
MDNHRPRRRPIPTLPAWIAETIDFTRRYLNPDAQIALAIALARANIDQASGGPFGAAVFDDAGKLVSVGVNRVELLKSSLAHAEIVALAAAQQKLERARLDDDGRRYTLASSSQPCCQCYGAIVWAGINTLVVAARTEDTESLAGFDEGPLPADWAGELEDRGIRVHRDLQREAACEVLAMYAAQGGARY